MSLCSYRALQDELKEVERRRVRIAKAEAQGELETPVRCVCCNQDTWHLYPNPDGVMVGKDCSGHRLGGCRHAANAQPRDTDSGPKRGGVLDNKEGFRGGS